jgi:hypothetical protein
MGRNRSDQARTGGREGKGDSFISQRQALSAEKGVTDRNRNICHSNTPTTCSFRSWWVRQKSDVMVCTCGRGGDFWPVGKGKGWVGGEAWPKNMMMATFVGTYQQPITTTNHHHLRGNSSRIRIVSAKGNN